VGVFIETPCTTTAITTHVRLLQSMVII